MNLEISQKLEPQLKQSLELALSPKMLQMLKILNLPYIELVEQIDKEAGENVMLEVERPDELFEFIKYVNSDKKIKKEADFTEIPGLENIGDTAKALEEVLLEQLDLENLNETQRSIGEHIIDNINDRGFIENYAEVRDGIIKELGVSRPTVDKVLKIIQSFEPDGVGARNLKECLLIQIREYNFENYELEEVLTQAVSKHLEDIAEGKLDKVAKDMGIPVDGVKRIAEYIKVNLTPNPGSCFASESRHVIPSFAVEKTDKGYKVTNLEQNYGPLLKISPDYMKMLKNPKTDEKTSKFLKEKLEAAKALMGNLQKRHETTSKILEKIKETQIDFMKNGAVFLKPLLQKELAGEFGVHPSTISRAIACKYIQTPQGLFQIKFLCPRNLRGFTAYRLKSMISKIVAGEEKALSDDEIKSRLVEEGANISRRSVAVYRKELGIPTCRERSKK
jgi:RNA polymerase sigma-54 factor